MEEVSTGTEPRVPAVKPDSKPDSFKEVPPLLEAAATATTTAATVAELLKKTSARQISKTASPVEQFRQTLHQDYEVSVKELDNLLYLLAEKGKMEQEEAERNMQILLDFLHYLRKQKVGELNEVQTDLQFIKEDIFMPGDDSSTRKPWPSSVGKKRSGIISSSLNVRVGMSAGNLQNKKIYGKEQVGGHGPQRKDALSGADAQGFNQSGLSVARKKQVHSQFNDLQECYLQKRRQMANQLHIKQESDKNAIRREDFNAVLQIFSLRLRVIVELRLGDLFHSANKPSLAADRRSCALDVWNPRLWTRIQTTSVNCETNEVYVYQKEISKPITWQRFGSQDIYDADEDAGSHFISTACWKSDSPTILAANSQGTIKVLVLAS
ncbi:hypothetical protein CRYUN_Cryun23aG0040500 [Craigia yunnanensis]